MYCSVYLFEKHAVYRFIDFNWRIALIFHMEFVRCNAKWLGLLAVLTVLKPTSLRFNPLTPCSPDAFSTCFLLHISCLYKVNMKTVNTLVLSFSVTLCSLYNAQCWCMPPASRQLCPPSRLGVLGLYFTYLGSFDLYGTWTMVSSLMYYGNRGLDILILIRQWVGTTEARMVRRLPNPRLCLRSSCMSIHCKSLSWVISWSICTPRGLGM